MRFNYTILWILLIMVFTIPSLANDIIHELKTSYVTKYDLGVYKIYIASSNWATKYMEDINIIVTIGENEEKGINFTIHSSSQFHKLKNKKQIEEKCSVVAQKFLAMVLGNFGKPSRNNIQGTNIYYTQWGAYFALAGSSRRAIEEIGKAVSKGSKTTIYTGNSVLEECEYKSGEKYERTK